MSFVLVSCLGEKPGLYSLDLESGEIEPWDDIPGRGLCWVRQDEDTGPTLARVVLDNAVQLVNVRRRQTIGTYALTPLLPVNPDYHDIAWDWRGNKLWVSNTGRNQLDIFDPYTFKRRASIEIGDERNRDTIHLNSFSLHYHGEDLLPSVYLCCFSEPNQTEWSHDISLASGAILYWDCHSQSIRTLISRLHTPHTLRIQGDRGWICNSMRSTFCFLYRSKQVWSFVNRIYAGKGYLRGFAPYGEGWLFGLSALRGSEENGSKISHVGKSGQLIQCWNLPASDIYDLLIFDSEKK